MTEVAALQMNVDSSSVVKATNDLDAFSAASKRAGSASGAPSGSIAKLATTVQALYAKLGSVVATLDKIERHMGSMAKSAQMAAAANDNIASSAAKAARAFDNADSHVNAYRDHLERLVAASKAASAAQATAANDAASAARQFASADAHVLAYAEHLRQLASVPPAPPPPSPPSSGGGGGGAAPSRGSSSPYYGSANFEATGQAAELASHQVQNLFYQLNDVFVSLASGQAPLTVFIQQGSQIGQVYAETGLGVKGFALALANMLGLLKSTTAATEAAALAQAQQTTASIAAANAQAASAVRAAETNIAIAQTQIAMATTATEAAAAQARLTIALEALGPAQAEAAITARALAKAQEEQAAAAAAARGATVTSVTALGATIAAVTVVLGVFALALASIKNQANDDSGLKKFTTSMGYTKAEVLKLNAVTVTWGDTFKAVFQVGFERVAKAFGVSTADIRSMWTNMLADILADTRKNVSEIYGLIVAIKRAGDNKPGALLDPKKMWGEAKKNYAEATADALRFFDDAAKKAGQNARDRQDKMAKAMYDKPSAPKAAHQFDFSDLMKEAAKMENDLTKAAAQIGLYGEALARVTYEQDLFNKASEQGLKLSPAQRSAISGVATELAKLAEANRLATFREETKQAAFQQFQALKDAAAQIGVYGRDLTALRIEQEMLNKAVAAHITLTENDREVIAAASSALADKEYANTRAQSKADNAKSHAEAMRQLDVERGALGLTGEALISYNYQQELINKSLQAGVAFKDLDIEKTRKQGDAYAKAAADLAKAQEMEGVKTRGLDTFNNGIADAIMGVKSLGSVFKDVANQIISDLLRIAIRRAITEPLGSALFGAGGGGSAFANGGAFGTAQRFANGGAFTNSIVNSPTLFKFANGSKFGLMGEAGPEAVMPLARDSSGKLGVRTSGSGGRSSPPQVSVSIQQDFHLTGTVSQSDVEAMSRRAAEQGADAAVTTVRRNFNSYMSEWDVNATSVG